VSTRPRSNPPSDVDRADWLRPIVLGVSCLVIGFVFGWVARGGGDGSQSLVDRPPPTETTATTPTTATTGTTPTAPSSTTPSGTSPIDTTATTPLPPDRSTVRLAVLNGTGVTGLAGRTATSAESLGYVNVTTGNAPAQTGASIVYYRPGSREAARQVAQDLDILGGASPLPEGGALAEAAPPDADVIAVLGPGQG
jgi:LytR cell envelope-related transcriptional attenuator